MAAGPTGETGVHVRRHVDLATCLDQGRAQILRLVEGERIVREA